MPKPIVEFGYVCVSNAKGEAVIVIIGGSNLKYFSQHKQIPAGQSKCVRLFNTVTNHMSEKTDVKLYYIYLCQLTYIQCFFVRICTVYCQIKNAYVYSFYHSNVSTIQQ